MERLLAIRGPAAVVAANPWPVKPGALHKGIDSMSHFVRRVLIALAVVGFASAATSTYVHYQLARDPGYTSFCDINDSVSCTQVYLSRFGSVAGTFATPVLTRGRRALRPMSSSRAPLKTAARLPVRFSSCGKAGAGRPPVFTKTSSSPDRPQ